MAPSDGTAPRGTQGAGMILRPFLALRIAIVLFPPGAEPVQVQSNFSTTVSNCRTMADSDRPSRWSMTRLRALARCTG